MDSTHNNGKTTATNINKNHGNIDQLIYWLIDRLIDWVADDSVPRGQFQSARVSDASMWNIKLHDRSLTRSRTGKWTKNWRDSDKLPVITYLGEGLYWRLLLPLRGRGVRLPFSLAEEGRLPLRVRGRSISRLALLLTGLVAPEETRECRELQKNEWENNCAVIGLTSGDNSGFPRVSCSESFCQTSAPQLHVWTKPPNFNVVIWSQWGFDEFFGCELGIEQRPEVQGQVRYTIGPPYVREEAYCEGFFFMSPWPSNCQEWCRNWPTES